MEERLAAELHVNEDENIQSAHFARQDAVVARGEHITSSIVDDVALSPEVQALIERCMEGTEPWDKGEREYWQSQKLSPQQIQVVMLCVAGFKQVEIAKMLGLDAARVNVTCQHPYSKKIVAAMLPTTATRVIDIRTRMEVMAGQLMDHAFGLAIMSKDVKEVKDVTFGFLDRAGYGAVNKSATLNVSPKDLREASGSALTRMASALEESKVVDAVVMPGWKTPVPPEDPGQRVENDRFEADHPVPAEATQVLGVAPATLQRTGTHN
jgi:hypothetical protein